MNTTLDNTSYIRARQAIAAGHADPFTWRMPLADECETLDRAGQLPIAYDGIVYRYAVQRAAEQAGNLRTRQAAEELLGEIDRKYASREGKTLQALERYYGAEVGPLVLQRRQGPVLAGGYSSEVVAAQDAEGMEEAVLTFAMTTYRFDRANDRVDPEGANLRNYLENNVVLWCHDVTELPIGKGMHPRLGAVNGEKALLMDVHFQNITEFGREIHALARAGYIRSGSIGFIPLEWRDEEAGPYIERGQAYPFLDTVRTYTRWELLEFSLCNVPMNPGALVQPEQEGPDIRRAIREHIIRPDGEIANRLGINGKLFLNNSQSDQKNSPRNSSRITTDKQTPPMRKKVNQNGYGSLNGNNNFRTRGADEIPMENPSTSEELDVLEGVLNALANAQEELSVVIARLEGETIPTDEGEETEEDIEKVLRAAQQMLKG